MRFSSYATLYFQGAAFAGLAPGNRYPLLDKMSQLYLSYSGQQAEYEAGKLAEAPIRPMSRAYSRVVGWIGLWMPGELATVPGGRFLIPYDETATPNKVSNKVSPSNLPGPFTALLRRSRTIATGPRTPRSRWGQRPLRSWWVTMTWSSGSQSISPWWCRNGTARGQNVTSVR